MGLHFVLGSGTPNSQYTGSISITANNTRVAAMYVDSFGQEGTVGSKLINYIETISPTITAELNTVTTNNASFWVTSTTGSSGVKMYELWVRRYGTNDSWSSSKTFNTTEKRYKVDTDNITGVTISPGQRYEICIRVHDNAGQHTDWYGDFTTEGKLEAPVIEIIGTEKNGWYPAGTKVRVYDPTPESETTVANMSYGLHGELTTNMPSRDFTIDITESGEYNFVAASYDSTGKESEKTYKTFKADTKFPTYGDYSLTSQDSGHATVSIPVSDSRIGNRQHFF